MLDSRMSASSCEIAWLRMQVARRAPGSSAPAASRAFGERQVRFGVAQRRLVRTRIDQKQQVALLDDAAVLEMDRLQVAAHARPDLDRVDRFEARGVLVPFRDLARNRLHHIHLGRRWRRRRGFAARGEQRSEHEEERSTRFGAVRGGAENKPGGHGRRSLQPSNHGRGTGGQVTRAMTATPGRSRRQRVAGAAPSSIRDSVVEPLPDEVSVVWASTARGTADSHTRAGVSPPFAPRRSRKCRHGVRAERMVGARFPFCGQACEDAPVRLHDCAGERLVTYAKAFIAGFLSTLVFHQGLLTLFWLSGAFPRAPYSLEPAGPLGVPAVISLAFWGGVWAAVIWPLLKAAVGASYWLRALLLGALGPTAVALFVVFPLKGMQMAAGWDPKLIVGALILNGVWGLGVALFMRAFSRPHAAARLRRRSRPAALDVLCDPRLALTSQPSCLAADGDAVALKSGRA